MNDDSSNGYHISFFKPTTPQAKANRNMVIWLVLIWSIAIFGFHFALRIIEKPTPEPAYVSFEKVWSSIENGSAQLSEIQEFGKATLSVLGKIAITPQDKLPLNNAISWSVYQTTPDPIRTEIISKVQHFEKLKTEVEVITDQDYINAKLALGKELNSGLQLAELDIRTKILPLEVYSESMLSLTEETRASLPGVMKKYLIHNQSILTDARFLGFPFHYFYTAIFLLILFIGLCWVYCVKTDQINAKFKIID